MSSIAAAAALLLIAIAAVWKIGQLRLKFYALALGFPSRAARIYVKQNLLVPLSDGVKLTTDVYLPKRREKYPAIVIRTPYRKNREEHNYTLIASLFACQGYAVVVQDVRGKYGSEGNFYPFVNEEKDGKEVLAWLFEQPWSDGTAATWGFSYPGTCAWLPAPSGPPGLKAVCSMFCCQNAYNGWIDKGVPYLKDILFWLSKHHGRRGREVTHEEIDKIILNLPVLEFDKRLKDGIETFKTWMAHLQEDEYWRSFSINHRLDEVKVPALLFAGWFDRFLNNSIQDFQAVRAEGPDSLLSKSQLFIGPWGHQPGSKFPGIHFGYGALFRHQLETIVRWYDYWLRGKGEPFDDALAVTYFMMGKNEWRKSASWPPEGATEIKWYCKSNGRANKGDDNGRLTKSLPPQVQTDHYVYDPETPAPSIGNRMLYGNDTDGPRTQEAVIRREDVLVYSSETLKEELEVTGPVTAVLYVSSSARDTDFAAKICDQHPNGRSYFLANGFVRMRFLDSVRATHGIEGDKIYRVEIYLGDTAHTFLKGHRIQLQISSSDFPNHERNLNTGGSNEGDSEEVKAFQTIYHGGTYDTHLILPCLFNS